MRFSKVFRQVILSGLIMVALTGCGSDNPPKNDEEMEPMVIERGDTSEGDPENIWDEAFDTHLILRIQRIVFTSHPGSEVKLEIETTFPLFSQGEGEEARVYGEGSGKGTIFGGVEGVGVHEGEWGMEFQVIGEVRTDCSMWLTVEEEWFEGVFCTTVMGQQSCETSKGEVFQLAYGVLKFPFILGQADNIENLNFEAGNTSFATFIEVVTSGEEAINLPNVGNCEWDELE